MLAATWQMAHALEVYLRSEIDEARLQDALIPPIPLRRSSGAKGPGAAEPDCVQAGSIDIALASD